MTQLTKFKASIFTSLITAAAMLSLSSCKAPAQSVKKDAASGAQSSTVQNEPAPKLAPISKALACLPENAAIIAAHRGTDERWRDKAENSIGALEALIDHGTLMAEIDVAGLRDGTLITFHDGVWDDISTGKGPIASTRKSGLENILLKTRTGQLTAERPALFTEMLNRAKGRIYLEIDFKSSADYRDVIKSIRSADMADQVLLISYNPRQSADLKRLAPDMLRSDPPAAAQKGHAIWLGYGVASGGEAAALKAKGHYTIGRIGDPRRQPPFSALKKSADILVTDQAKRYGGIEGLNKKSRASFEACLAK